MPHLLFMLVKDESWQLVPFKSTGISRTGWLIFTPAFQEPSLLLNPPAIRAVGAHRPALLRVVHMPWVMCIKTASQHSRCCIGSNPAFEFARPDAENSLHLTVERQGVGRQSPPSYF